MIPALDVGQLSQAAAIGLGDVDAVEKGNGEEELLAVG
jgi:hypothetical protein